MLTSNELTEPERDLYQAVAMGALVDLRTGNADQDAPASGATWDGTRTVRAELLAELLTSVHHPDDVGRVRAVKLRGARIIGELDLEAARLVCPLLLSDCYFEQPVNLREAQAPVVRLPGCHLPALVADQLETRGDLELAAGFTARRVRLAGARIGGLLDFDGATLSNLGGVALNGYGLTVELGMSCGDGFTAEGMIFLLGAKIGGGLSFIGAKLTNPDGWVLDAQGMTVGYALFLGSALNVPGGFVAQGGVRLVGVHIDGFVCCWDATLNNPGGIALAASGLTIKEDLLCSRGFSAIGELHLVEARIGTALDFHGATLTNPDGPALSGERLVVGQSMECRGGFTAHGTINLTRAQIDGELDFTGAVLDSPDGNALTLAGLRTPSLILRPATPPTEVDLRDARVGVLSDDPTTWPAVLHLRNFAYDVLAEQPAVSVARRLAWIRRDSEGYLPQLYEQLATTYRRAGQEEAARRVAIAKQWRRRGALNSAGKLWNWLLYLTVGYGYRTWQAGLWLLALLILGTRVFGDAYPAHMVATKQPAPAFNAVAYTVDVLLPIINLGQQDAWQPTGAALRWSWVLIGAGWVLTTAAAAGLTGILKRD